MILIKITKENREPEVGEWTIVDDTLISKCVKVEPGDDVFHTPSEIYFKEDHETTNSHCEGTRCKALSLSVILDAPHWLLDLDWEKNYNKEAFQSFPISNSEEIFQWLHDQGKLGEEWVEWEGDNLFDWDDSVILRSTERINYMQCCVLLILTKCP